MALSERVDSRSLGKDSEGKLRGRMTFDADSPPPTALNEPGLPVLGTGQFPGGTPELVCDSIEASYAPGTLNRSVLEAVFSTDKSGTFGGANPIDPSSPGFLSWSIDYRVVEVAIPYYITDPRRYSYVDMRQTPPAERTITGYANEEDVHTEIFKTITLRVNIGPPFLPADFEPTIGEQVNKLHKIGSYWYRFSAGTIEMTSANRWRTEYLWERDKGTPNIWAPPTPPLPPPTSAAHFPYNLQSAIPVVYPGVLFARPPFHKVIAEPGSYDPGPPPFIGPPKFTPIPLYAAAENGHLQLPGWV